MTEIDIAIIGGGVIGLTAALSLAKKFPQYSIFVFEQEKFLGDHTTGRNSGVLHSGIYYEKNSLKHKLCMEGNILWNEYSHESGSKLVEKPGKYIFSTSESETDILQGLFKKSNENELKNVRWASQDEVNDLKKYCAAYRAIFVPSTGMIDVPLAIKRLEFDFAERGGNTLKSHKITDLEKVGDKFEFQTKDGKVSAAIIINAAGLWSVNLGSNIWKNGLENYFVKGTYLKYSGNFFKKSFLYPCPLPNLKGLGTHSTFDCNGDVKFGPNTQDVEEINYLVNDESVQNMKREILKLYPGLDQSKLAVDYCGIRPKIKKNGQLYNDFWIKGPTQHGVTGYIEVCGVESPGLTASLAIGNYIANLL